MLPATTDSACVRARGDAGFTLIEVLVAMLILAVGLLGVEAMAIGASRQIAVANRTTQYTLVATQELETALMAARNNIDPEASSYSLPDATTVDVVPDEVVQPDGSSLWVIEVTVTPPAGDHLALDPITVTGRALSPLQQPQQP